MPKANHSKERRIADFLFEVGTMRKLIRMHRQTLLTDDMSDNIATHSYRVAIIGWFLAKEEKVDPYKVVMMSLLHDIGEVRTNDHNWVHKKYIKIFDDEIRKEQLSTLPYKDFQEFSKEYDERKTKESLIAKDADLLDQILLLREYEWQGNKEAKEWLRGKKNGKGNVQFKRLKLQTSKRIALAMYKQAPSDWWGELWTYKNR